MRLRRTATGGPCRVSLFGLWLTLNSINPLVLITIRGETSSNQYSRRAVSFLNAKDKIIFANC